MHTEKQVGFYGICRTEGASQAISALKTHCISVLPAMLSQQPLAETAATLTKQEQPHPNTVRQNLLLKPCSMFLPETCCLSRSKGETRLYDLRAAHLSSAIAATKTSPWTCLPSANTVKVFLQSHPSFFSEAMLGLRKNHFSSQLRHSNHLA